MINGHGWKNAGLLMAAAALSGCTTAAYRPAVTDLNAATEAAGAIVTTESKNYYREYRVSLLNQNRTTSASNAQVLTEIVCGPIPLPAAVQTSGDAISGVAKRANKVATVPEQSFWNRLAGLWTSYDIPDIAKAEPIKDGDKGNKPLDESPAQKTCVKDVSDIGMVDQILTGSGGKQSLGASFAAFQELIGVFEPVATQILSEIDERRRVAALESFFEKDQNFESMNIHVENMRHLSIKMDRYRRVRAMSDLMVVVKTLPPTWDTLKLPKESAEKVIAGAEKYDAAAQAQLDPAFKKLSGAIKNLHDIANGTLTEENTAEMLKSVADATNNMAKAIAGLEKLATDPEEKKKLRALWRKLLGMKPEVEAEAPKA